MNDKYYLSVSKLKKAEDYSKKLKHILFKKIIGPLNTIHNVDYTEKKWCIIIFPWLSRFVDNFVHYNILKKKLNSEDINSNNSENNIALNHSAFGVLVSDVAVDYSKIYLNNFLKSELNKNLKTAKIFNPKKKKYSIINKVINFYNSLVVCLPHFYTDIYSKKLIIKLIIKFRSLPVLLTYQPDPHILNNKIQIDLRKKFYNLISYNLKDQELKRISRFLAHQIPMSYMENFRKYKDFVEKKSFNKTVFFLFTYSTNDIVKFLVSEYKKTKKLTIIYQHGGGYNKLRYYDEEEYNFKISDLFLLWSKSKNKKAKQVPCQYFIPKNKKKLKKYEIVIINAAFPIFHRYNFPLIGDKILISLSQQFKFIKSLKNNSRKRLSVRFADHHPYFISATEAYKKANINIKEIKLGSYKNFIGNSNLVVHTYFSTTFFQSIVNDIPTILLIKKNSYLFNTKFNIILNKLYKNKILHYSASSAADHVDKIYPNIDLWWKKKEVIKVKNELRNKYGYTNNNWGNEWAETIYDKINNKNRY